MSSQETGPPNHLANETSLYLRQHMYNPVEWYPWGPEALERAQREDKPLLVSIGYSACHWCHVMEHESFEDPATAALMNEAFVCIKVDREERPDVDQIYMDTVVRMHGHGGWPLNVFCTPDGRPFYGGTYFPPEPRHGMPPFRQVLTTLARAYHEERDQVEETARNVMDALAQRPTGVADAPPGAHLAEAATRAVLGNADRTHGGFGNAPKFPTPTNLDLLLATAPELPEALGREALDHVVLSCREMARGGIYDQLGGGFHRYSVDGEWLVPHFEKMLYDEGQLVRTYAEAWRLTGCSDATLTWPIEETVEYLRREMRGPEGAFFASQDADSEGVEGRFYVWTPDQVEDVLGEAATAFGRTFDVTPHGNFEGTNILRDLDGGPRERLAEERRALFQARTRRVPPATDEKRVAAWNGLAISGLARAGSLLDAPLMVADAARAADFVLCEMRDDRGRLLRVFNAGRARVPGFLDDVAALLEASLDLYRAGAGDRFLAAALELADDVRDRFFEADEGDVFLTPRDGEPLAHRPRSDHDGATPNAAGWALLGLLRAATLAGRNDLHDVASAVLRTHAFAMERAPHAFPTLVRAAILADRGNSVAVVVGAPEAEETRALAARARRLLRPEDAVVVSAPDASPPSGLDPFWLHGRSAVGGQATAYLCHGTRCSLPVTDPDALASAAPGAD